MGSSFTDRERRRHTRMYNEHRHEKKQQQKTTHAYKLLRTPCHTKQTSCTVINHDTRGSKRTSTANTPVIILALDAPVSATVPAAAAVPATSPSGAASTTSQVPVQSRGKAGKTGSDIEKTKDPRGELDVRTFHTPLRHVGPLTTHFGRTECCWVSMR